MFFGNGFIETSQITRNLLTNGRLGQGAAYDIDFYKDIPLEKAKNELAALGIRPDEILLEEQEGDIFPLR